MFGIGLGITHLPMRSPAFARPKIIASLIVGIVAAGLYGSVNGTYTNSSSGRTIADHEGLLRSALASESRHGGARRVRNLASTINVSTWATTSNVSVTSGVSDPFGGTSAYTITATGASGYCADLISTRLQVGSRVVNSCYVRRRTGVGVVSMYNGETGAAGQVMTSVITSGWQRICTNPTAVTVALTGYIGFNIGTSGDAIDVYWPQPEDNVGASVTAPSELVDPSVQYGVNVAGVQLFATQNGNTVASNVVTAGTGAAIPTATLLGYLAEPAATNLIRQSSDLNTTWVKTGATINATKVLGPRGTVTAQKIEETAASSPHRVEQQLIKAASAIQYTGSASLKQAERTWALMLLLNAAGTTYAGYWFNLATGALGSSTNAGAYVLGAPKITPLANGFWRCSITGTTDAAAETNLYIYVATGDGAVSYAGSAGSGIYCEDVQLETGAVATSEILTTTGAVSKNKDLDSYPVAGYVNTNDITIPLTWTPGAPPANNGTVNLWGSYVDANNSTLIFHDATSITVRKRIAGVNYDATKALAYTANQTYRIAARFSSTTGIDVFVDGVIGVNHANTANLQLGTTFQVGADGNGVVGGIQYIKNVRPTPSALSASAIGALAA